MRIEESGLIFENITSSSGLGNRDFKWGSSLGKGLIFQKGRGGRFMRSFFSLM